MPILKRHDRYFLKIALINMALATAAFALLYVVIDITYKLDYFSGRNIPVTGVIEYYALHTPGMIHALIPLAVLLGGGFGIAHLVRNRELLPLSVAGMRRSRALRSFWIAAALAGGCMVAAQEVILPRLEQAAANSRYADIKHGSAAGGVALNDDAGNLWYVARYDVFNATPWVEDAHIMVLDRFGSLQRRVFAPRLEYRDDQWRGNYRVVEISELNNPTRAAPEVQYRDAALADVAMTPALLSRQGQGRSVWKISELLAAVRQTPHVPEPRLNLYRALLYPLSCVSLLMLGAVLLVRLEVRAMFVAAAVTLAVAFGSFAMSFFAEGLARRNALSPELAGIGPPALLLALALWALYAKE